MRYGLLVVLVVGCHGGDAGSEYEAATLEKASVLADSELPEDVRSDWQGDVTSEGSGANWTLAIQTATTSVGLEIRSPGQSDLSVLNLTGAKVSVQPETFSNELSMSVADADGELMYLVEPVGPGPLTEQWFGQGQIAPTESLYSLSLNGWDLTLEGAVFRTDDGDVDLLPGAPVEVALDGNHYRVVLLESFSAELLTNALVQCTGASQRLAFEVVRVEPGTADLTPLVRDPTLDIPTSECTVRTQ